ARARSTFRNARLPHTLDHPFALGEKDRIVALGGDAEAGKREFGRDREARPGFRLCLALPAKKGEGRSVVEMVEREIPAGVDRLAEKLHRLLVSALVELRESVDIFPKERDAVDRRNPEGLGDMRLGFLR